MKPWIRRTAAAALSGVMALALLAGCNKAQEETQMSDAETRTGFRLEYDEGVTVVDDGDALQRLVDEMQERAQERGFQLEYQNNGYSSNGTDFECYLANATDNTLDMFIEIYGDAAYADQLFLSGLLRPGTAFDHISLNHALDPGDHTVYVIFTQIKEDENGEQMIHNQVPVELSFHVTQ